jgi:uncharacterized membrane protein (UPF0127 family)
LLVVLLWARRPTAAEEARGNRPEKARLPTIALVIKNQVFTLEVAATPAQWERGLMQRRSIPYDGGMLFVFPDDQVRRFWMCHTLTALDLAFLDREGRVVALHTMQPEPPPAPGENETAYRERLPLYSSRVPCRYAIEFKAGTFGLLQLAVGDRIALDTDALQRLVDKGEK